MRHLILSCAILALLLIGSASASAGGSHPNTQGTGVYPDYGPSGTLVDVYGAWGKAARGQPVDLFILDAYAGTVIADQHGVAEFEDVMVPYDGLIDRYGTGYLYVTFTTSFNGQSSTFWFFVAEYR